MVWLLIVLALVSLILFCCGVPVGVFAVLMAGALVLRAAVFATNRTLRPFAPADPFGQWDDWDTGEPGPTAGRAAGRSLPRPSLATGMLVTLPLGVVAVVGYMALVFVAEEAFGFDGPAVVWVFLFGLPFTGLALSALVAALLPTTFKRALVVAFWYHLLGGFALLCVGAMGAVAWVALGW